LVELGLLRCSSMPRAARTFDNIMNIWLSLPHVMRVKPGYFELFALQHTGPT
jgi:hypothetical protein